jgi:hypothetical protein
MGKAPGWFVALQAILLLGLLGFSPAESLKILLALTIVSLFGTRLTRQLGFAGLAPTVGWLLGMSLQTLGSQALVLAGLSAQLSQIAVLVAFSGYVISPRLFANDQGRRGPDLTTLQFALAVCLLASAIRFTWLLPFVFCCVLGWISLSRLNQLVMAKSASILALAIGTIASFVARPELWYLQNNNDAPFFEALSWSITRWGVFDHPGFVGGSIAGYHWLAYGLLGSVSILGDLEPWEGMLQFLPVGMLAATATMVWAQCWEDLNTRKSTDPMSVTVATAATLLFTGFFPDSYNISMIVAVAYIAIAKEVSAHPKPLYKSMILCFLMSITLVLSKVSTAIVVAGILFIASLFEARSRSRANWMTPFLILMLSLTSSVVMTEISEGKIERLTYITRVSSYLANLQEVLRALISAPQNYLIVASFVVVLTVSRQNVRYRISSDVLYLSIVFAALLGFVPLFIFNLSSNAFFGMPALQILGLFSVLKLDSIWRHREVPPPHLAGTRPLLFVSFVTLFTIGYRQLTWWVNNEVIDLATVLPKNFQALVYSPLPIVVSMMTGALFFLNRDTSYLRSERLSATFVLVSVGFLIGNLLFANVESSRSELHHYTEGIEPAYPADDLKALGRFVRDNTQADTILASNNFCCFGMEWAGSQLSDNWYGGANYLLPAETQRRFLVQGPRFQGSWKSSFPSTEMTERLRFTLEFANSPNAKAVAALRDRGVDGFIVNLELTNHRDWSRYARERFRAGRFIYLSLDTN